MPYTIGLHYWRYGIGGGEHVTYELMKIFRQMGHDVVLFTDLPKTSEDYPVPAGVERLSVPLRSNDTFRSEFWEAEIARRGIDLVVYGSWLSPTAKVDCEAIRDAGARLVYLTHGVSTYFMDKDDGIRMLDTMLGCARVADAVACLSEADAIFWSTFCGNAFTVTNPIGYLDKVPATSRASEHGHEVVWCGRFDPIEKRPELALRSFAALLAHVPDATLTMVGGGNPDAERSVRALAAELGVADSVTFVGQVIDVTPWFAHADVNCMTSPTEGFPLSLCEAMHAGLPTVMFRMPWLTLGIGCKAVVQVEADDPEAMGEALARVLTSDDYALLCSCARARYEWARDVDVAGDWRKIVEAAMSGRVEPKLTPVTRQVLSTVDAYRRLSAVSRAREANLAEKDAELVAARADADEVRAELAAVTGSLSFRLGRLATAVPRILRDVILRGRK